MSAVLPITVLADAGTPLVWAGLAHLLVGNFAIGIGEGLLIAWLFKTDRNKTTSLSVLANYFSAFCGMFFVSWLAADKVRPNLYQAPCVLISAAVATYLLSIILEWPFIAVCFKKRVNWFSSSWKASFIAQTASYALLVPYYLTYSNISLFTLTHLDASYSQWADKKAVIFYISNSDNHVYRIDLSGTQPQLASTVTIAEKRSKLFLKEAADGNKYDLYAVEFGFDLDRQTKILENVWAKASAPVCDIYQSYQSAREHVRGPIPDLRPENEKNWTVSTQFNAIDGLTFENTNTGKRFRLALETIFFGWGLRCATILPGDQIVFEAGDQVCILDRPTMKLAAVANGRGPVALKVQEPQNVSGMARATLR
jgi:hypothetical protein